MCWRNDDKRIQSLAHRRQRTLSLLAVGRPNILGEDEWPDIHVITGVFKAWLRELPDPLLTHDLFIELTDLVEGLSLDR